MIFIPHTAYRAVDSNNKMFWMMPGDICFVIDLADASEETQQAYTRSPIIHPCRGLSWTYVETNRGEILP
jgi:hypothetical protein